MSVSKTVIRRWIVTAAKILISCLALIFVFRKIDSEALWNVLKESKLIFLALAAIFFILSKILSSFRLNIFFKSSGLHLTDSFNLKLYWLGMFYNLFLPGGIGGDGYKAYYLHKKSGQRMKKIILAILFDRFTGLLSLIVLCMLFGILIGDRIIPSLYLISVIPVCILLFYITVYRWFRIFFDSLNKTNLLAAGTQVAQVISAILILKALGNDQFMVEYLFVFLVSSVIAVIPFTLGGIGAREVAFFYAARIFDLDVPTSIALSLMFFFITALVSLYGIIFVFGIKYADQQN